jgi:hypothetical protein
VLGEEVGISEAQTEGLQIFPNPTHDRITITGMVMHHIVVYDITGKIIRKIDINGASQTNISVSELKNGLYFLRIFTDENVYIKRFSVIR